MGGGGLRAGQGGRLRRLAAPAGIAILALGVANCSGRTAMSGKHPSELKYGVASSPRVIAEGQPVPKGGGRDMVGKPYVVAGRTYTPHPGKGYDRVGSASWYGSAFHGRLTANGEVFDRESVAAAHPTLPLPSYVRVSNLENGRSMIVRVNDRGPYEYNRIIDLSERASHALGFHRRGTSRVRVQYVGRASLGGSDDTKLLATLTTNGAPAQPVMVAQNQPPAAAPQESRSQVVRTEPRPFAPMPAIAALRAPARAAERSEPRVQLAVRGERAASEAREEPMDILPRAARTFVRAVDAAPLQLSRRPPCR